VEASRRLPVEQGWRHAAGGMGDSAGFRGWGAGLEGLIGL
jgi:hypothetical protein